VCHSTGWRFCWCTPYLCPFAIATVGVILAHFPIRGKCPACSSQASQHRRGGLAGLHRQLTEALEALDRIEGEQAERLQLALWPQDLTRQAFALEEQATAWWQVGWGDQLVVALEGDECWTLPKVPAR
jgi:hypothetical protein